MWNPKLHLIQNMPYLSMIYKNNIPQFKISANEVILDYRSKVKLHQPLCKGSQKKNTTPRNGASP